MSLRKKLGVAVYHLRQATEFPTKWLTFRMNRVRVPSSVVYHCKGHPFIRNQGTFVIEPGVRLNSRFDANPIGHSSKCSFVVKPGGVLRIGEGSGISNAHFVCTTSIELGKECLIGGDVKIYDTDFHPLSIESRMSREPSLVKRSPVRLEDRVFVGTGAIILKGVVIGAGSIVGAGSVVTKSIPAGEIWGGNPSARIREAKQ